MKRGPLTAADVFTSSKPVDNWLAKGPREFQVVGDEGYKLTILEPGIQFEVDRLRRERHELVGELAVRCDLAGARTVDGSLSVGDFNLSSIQARQTLAKHLGERANTKPGEVDWYGLLEEFVQRVHTSERTGQPSKSLRDFEAPEADDEIEIDGFRLPTRHPLIEFGDGGTLKSYHALYVAAELVRRGLRVGFFDWELDGSAHRVRLQRLSGADMPDVRYVRCERPLVYEIDRLRRIVRDDRLDYAIFDSIGFACAGPPESAEVAIAYGQAVRQLRIGSMHLAHITKAENGDQKPFGSVFWFNFGRMLWYTKRADAGTNDDHRVTVGLYNRKHNLGRLYPAIGIRVSFDPNRTVFESVNVADVQDLAAGLSLRQRIAHLLKNGAQTIATIANELGAKVDSVEKTIKRAEGKVFVRVPSADGVYRIGLVERRSIG